MEKVKLVVEGGVVDIDQLPRGIAVEVKDYDIEAYDEDDPRRQVDDDGRPFIKREYAMSA